MRTQPIFFLFVCLFHFFVFILYKVTSHHLSLNTEAGLTGRQAGARGGEGGTDLKVGFRREAAPSGIFHKGLQIKTSFNGRDRIHTGH